MNAIRSFYISLFEWVNKWFKPLAMLGLRWQIFSVFFYSGLAKWNGFLKPDPGVYDLFLYEFFLIVGLFTRFAAVGILGMVLFIQLAVFPTMSHWINPAAWWAAVAAALIVAGPGKLSLDYWFGFEKKQN